MKRFQISEEEYKEIQQAEEETNDKNVSRRLRVLMLRYEGQKVAKIAEMVGMRMNSISQLCRRYREQGLEEFKRNKYTSHRQALSKVQEEEIRQGSRRRRRQDMKLRHRRSRQRLMKCAEKTQGGDTSMRCCGDTDGVK